MTGTDTTLTPAVPRWYVDGPLAPEAVASALRAIYGVLRATRGRHDVFSALYDADRAAQSGYQMPEFEQIARTTLAMLVGISAREVRDPVRALQLWQSRNASTGLLWAVGEVLAEVSPEDRIAVEGDRALERERERAAKARLGDRR